MVEQKTYNKGYITYEYSAIDHELHMHGRKNLLFKLSIARYAYRGD